MNNLDSFDKMVARTGTIKITSETTKITKLPDDFEPKSNEPESDEYSDIIARELP